MPETHPFELEPPHVAIIGGGVAALETVLALHELAGDRVRVTLVAPEPEFILRPLNVAAPFSRGHADRLPLAQVMAEHAGTFIRSAVLSINASARTLTLTTGAELSYDALVLSLGASMVPAFVHALTFGDDPLAFNGILADLEQGYSGSVAFVVPDGCSWPLPLYELALMTAEEAWSMGMDRVELHLVTPEREPLELFGTEASAATRELLREARITTHLGVTPRIAHEGRVELGGGDVLRVDRVVAVPLLEGRRLRGIPADAHGFIPVDDAGRIDGLDSVYAIGDATDRPVKQGGLACQQADVTAAHIAARAGADVEVPPLRQVLRGRLLTGERDRFLRREPGGEAGSATETPLWWPPTKVAGRYLSPYLLAKDVVHLPPHTDPRGPGVDVEELVPHRRTHAPADVLELTPLRAITPLAGTPSHANPTPTESSLSV